MKKEYIILSIITVLVIASFYFGFNRFGSPFEQHNIKLDSIRVENLIAIKREIDYHYKNQNQLPQRLIHIKGTNYSPLKIKDPQTEKEYEYTVMTTNSYKLCAEFATDSKNAKKSSSNMLIDIAVIPGESFDHPKGKKCFELQVNQVNDVVPYNPDILTPKPIAQFEDINIDSVTTTASNIMLSRFPYGLFSSDTNESGLINYADEPVTITINFKNPVRVKSVSNLFNGCVPKNTCYWNGTATTINGKQIIFATDVTILDEVFSSQNIKSEDKISTVTMTAKRQNGNNYVHWKKIKFEYIQI